MKKAPAKKDVMKDRKKDMKRSKGKMGGCMKQVQPMSRHLEDEMQAAFTQWLSFSKKDLRKVSFAVPNGGKRDLREGARLKRQGVTSGVPDYLFLRPSGQYHGLCIEFKIKPNKVSPAQAIMMENLTQSGYKCQVCYTRDEAIACVEAYLIKDDGCLMQSSSVS